MLRNKIYLSIVLFFVLAIVVVLAVIYSAGNKKTYSKNGNNQKFSTDKSTMTVEDNEPIKKVQINESDRIVVTGTVDELSLDANTEKYTLSMLLNQSNFNQQRILVELGSPQYQHLVRYTTPKGKNNTIEEMRTMDSIAPILIKGKNVQIEISINPEIEAFWDTFTDTRNTNASGNTKRDEIFRIVLPSVISIKV